MAINPALGAKIKGNRKNSETYSNYTEAGNAKNDGENSGSDPAAMLRARNEILETEGPDALKRFDAELQQNDPDLWEAMRREDATLGLQHDDIGASGRTTQLLGQNVLDAEDTEAQLEALGMQDYTYTPEDEQGAGYQLADKVEHAGDADPLSYELQNEAINQGRTDTTGVDAQKNVLGEYASLYSQGGLSAIDRARMAQARQIRGTQNKGNRAAILQRMEQMGRAGGNAELLAQLEGQQASENALAMDDLQTEAMALERRDAILRDSGALGGQVQTAQDAIDRFNAEGERTRIRENLDRENTATDKVWSENQSRDVTNTAERNKAHGAQFDEDSARDTRNTDRATEAARFNVGPNQGRRGQIHDVMGARGIVAGARSNVANHLIGERDKSDAQQAAQQAAIVGALGTGAEIGTSIYGASQSGEDYEEEA